MNEEEVELLPTIAPAPKPPLGNDDIEAWQKHIMAMDKYILDMRMVIQKMDESDYSKAFKERMANHGMDIDAQNNLPKEVMENVSKKMNQILEKFRDMDSRLDVEAGSAHQSASRNSLRIKSKHSIKTI